MCVLMCVFRLFDCVNVLSQMWQRYGFTCWCVFFMCSVSSSRLRYTLLQTEQMNGFSSLWNFMWLARSDGCMNCTPHTMHTSWCVRMCVVRLFFWLNRLPQIVHAYGFSPVCVRMCVFRLFDWLKFLPQIVHAYGFSPRGLGIFRRMRLLLIARPRRRTTGNIRSGSATTTATHRELSLVLFDVLDDVVGHFVAYRAPVALARVEMGRPIRGCPTARMIEGPIFKLIFVDFHVRRKLIGRAERFVAYLAHAVRGATARYCHRRVLIVRLIARVRHLQVHRGRLLLGHVVDFHVQIEVHLRHERFVADLTLELFRDAVGKLSHRVTGGRAAAVLGLDDVLRKDGRTSFAATRDWHRGYRGRCGRLLLLLLDRWNISSPSILHHKCLHRSRVMVPLQHAMGNTAPATPYSKGFGFSKTLKDCTSYCTTRN
uniref:Uncharacterized protein n=1 Tax=Anopheles farauti TaxID=69004 RepID=A0A182Q0G9_9DIPT